MGTGTDQPAMGAEAMSLMVQNRIPVPVATGGFLIEQRQSFEAYVSSALKPEQDFMTIPGIQKPILTKAGAEKLCKYYGLFPQVTLVDKVEIWGPGEELDKFGGGYGFFRYKYNCEMIWPVKQDDGSVVKTVVGNCFGEANSRESKFAWRWINESDLTGQETEMAKHFGYKTDKSKAWAPMFTLSLEDKKKAKAENWDTEDRKSQKGNTNQWVKNPNTVMVRVPNEDIFSQVNSLDKMAQKRAFVGATTLATNASDLYTVDLDDSTPAPQAQVQIDPKGKVVEVEAQATEPGEFDPEPEGDKGPKTEGMDRSALLAKFKGLVSSWNLDRLKAESKRCFGKEINGTGKMTPEDLAKFIYFIQKDRPGGEKPPSVEQEKEQPAPSKLTVVPPAGSDDPSDPIDDARAKKLMDETTRLGNGTVESECYDLFQHKDLNHLSKEDADKLLAKLADSYKPPPEENKAGISGLPKYNESNEEIKWVKCSGDTCTADIYWGKNAQDNPHPYNADGSSHFSTCPDAAKFRGKVKKTKTDKGKKAEAKK